MSSNTTTLYIKDINKGSFVFGRIIELKINLYLILVKLAIITDIHEDLINLQKAFSKIEKFKVDDIVCLGDISGYSVPYYRYQDSRNAHECLKLVRSNCKVIVLGNHDIYAGHVLPKNCSFFNFPDNWYELDYHERAALAAETIWLHEEMDLNPLYTEDDIEFLKSLPEYQIMETPEYNILFTHYVYPNISGFKQTFYTHHADFIEHLEYMNLQKCKYSFTGHTHIRGFYAATKHSFHHYRYKKLKLSNSPMCVGIPAIARSKKRSGFCIFDSETLQINIIKL